MSEQKLATIVGIDLGTTHSCMAHVDDTGRAVTIRNAEGHLTTPSVVFFETPKNIVVGPTAKTAMVSDPGKVVAFMKRNMGDGNTTYAIEGETYRPEEVSSSVLKKLVKDASNALGETVTDVVITVPAYFGENERAATETAGKIAGLNVRFIINEPTAAAISYGIDQEDDQVVLVYDLGGGTFDVTMIEVKKKEISVVCTGGEHELGGKDWDDKLINHFASEWGEQTGQPDYDVAEEGDEETLNELRLLAEERKHELSAREQVSVRVQIEGERAKVDLSREKFDDLTADLLQRTMEFTHDTLADAKGKGIEDFDRILLVGGSTRMPQVKDRLEQEFPDKEVRIFDPDEAVAKGAALFACRLALGDEVEKEVEKELGDKKEASDEEVAKAEEEAKKKVARKLGLPPQKVEKLEKEIHNVTSKAFGVVALNEQNEQEVAFLIDRNERVPVDTTMPFGTSADDQETAEIRVMEAENNTAAKPDLCNQIGRAIMSLPPGLPRGSSVEITFRINEQGMMEAMAREMTKGDEVPVDIERGDFVMSDEQVKESSDNLQKFDVS